VRLVQPRLQHQRIRLACDRGRCRKPQSTGRERPDLAATDLPRRLTITPNGGGPVCGVGADLVELLDPRLGLGPKLVEGGLQGIGLSLGPIRRAPHP
jgi:hypothetical protein